MIIPEATHAGAPRITGGGRLRYIDALRGIAALLVLWLHVSNSYHLLSPETAAHGSALNALISRIDIGRIGVAVFFLISGFVVPFSIHRDSAAPVTGFAIRRVLRIYPAYWLSVPLAALVFFWLPGRPFATGDFLANLTLLQGVFGVPHAEGVYWTLPVELAFYLLCVLLLRTSSLFSPLRIAALCAVLASMHVFAMFMQWLGSPIVSIVAAFWPLNLSIMLWGTLFRLQTAEPSRDPRAQVALVALGVFFVVALPMMAGLAIHKAITYTIPYAIAFVVFLLGTGELRIETRTTDWLGRISYSIYLFHPIVFEAILLALVRQPAGSAWRTQSLGVYLAVNLALTLIVATLVFRFVEQPAIRWGHRLAARYERKRSRGNVGVSSQPGADLAPPARSTG